MKKSIQIIRNYPLSLLCLTLIVFLSLVIRIHHTPLDGVAFIDKWTHFVMYGGTCSVMWFEYLRHHQELNFWKLFLYAWLGPVILGGVIEILQPYFERSGEWLDFAADTVGTTLAVGIGLLMKKVKDRLPSVRRAKAGKDSDADERCKNDGRP